MGVWDERKRNPSNIYVRSIPFFFLMRGMEVGGRYTRKQLGWDIWFENHESSTLMRTWKNRSEYQHGDLVGLEEESIITTRAETFPSFFLCLGTWDWKRWNIYTRTTTITNTKTLPSFLMTTTGWKEWSQQPKSLTPNIMASQSQIPIQIHIRTAHELHWKWPGIRNWNRQLGTAKAKMRTTYETTGEIWSVDE